MARPYGRPEKWPETWATGDVGCLRCDEFHLATWLIGTEPLECPHCDEGCCVPVDGVGFAPDRVLARFGKHSG